MVPQTVSVLLFCFVFNLVSFYTTQLQRCHLYHSLFKRCPLNLCRVLSAQIYSMTLSSNSFWFSALCASILYQQKLVECTIYLNFNVLGNHLNSIAQISLSTIDNLSSQPYRAVTNTNHFFKRASLAYTIQIKSKISSVSISQKILFSCLFSTFQLFVIF